MKLFMLPLLFSITMQTIAEDNKAKNEEGMLNYLVREPTIKTGNPPVVILLHGIGSNEQDLFSFADQLPGNFLVVSARAPYSMGHDGYAWYSVDFSSGKPVIDEAQAEKSRNSIIAFITQLKVPHPFDDKQVYLCGFSQGAIMAYSLGLTRPDVVKGIAVMSGRLLSEVKPFIASNEKLRQLKVFISHGINDAVLNIQYAREGLAYLKKFDIHPVYKEYTEGHAINKEMLTDLVSWLGNH